MDRAPPFPGTLNTEPGHSCEDPLPISMLGNAFSSPDPTGDFIPKA